MLRYVTGLLGAFLVFGAALVIAPTSLFLIEGRPVRLTTSVDAWLQMGLLCTTGLALIIGPTVAATQYFSKRELPVMAASLAGASLGPALLIALWFVVRERDETLAALMQVWTRLPREFIVGVVPHAAASAFFTGWLVAGRSRQRALPSQLLRRRAAVARVVEQLIVPLAAAPQRARHGDRPSPIAPIPRDDD